jgi:hypothetical protein
VRRSFIPRARARIQQTNQSEFDVVRPSSTQSVRERGVQARADGCSMRAVQTSTRWRPNRPSALVQPVCSSHRDGVLRRSTHRGSQRASLPARPPLGGDRDEASHSFCDRAVLQREVRHVQQSLSSRMHFLTRPSSFSCTSSLYLTSFTYSPAHLLSVPSMLSLAVVALFTQFAHKWLFFSLIKLALLAPSFRSLYELVTFIFIPFDRREIQSERPIG